MQRKFVNKSTTFQIVRTSDRVIVDIFHIFVGMKTRVEVLQEAAKFGSKVIKRWNAGLESGPTYQIEERVIR